MSILRELVGENITTLTGQDNRVVEVEGLNIVVATSRSPEGQLVPIADVQSAIDQLFANGVVNINPDSVGYRSAFIGAVLSTLPGTSTETLPARVFLRVGEGSSPGWTLQPGDRILRAAIHEEFGGNHDRGISFSAKTPNIFIFSHSRVGSLNGYMDHWVGDVLHYYGEGRVGDQQLTQGNLALAEHRERGRSLRVFQGSGGTVIFLGTFKVDAAEPFYWTESLDANGESRHVVVFRLVSVEADWLKGDFPTLSAPPLIHDELQEYIAELTAGAGCEPLFAEGTLFETGWVTPSGTRVVAEIRDCDPASEDEVVARAIGHLLLAAWQLGREEGSAVALLFLSRRPENQDWTRVCENHGIVLGWPGIDLDDLLN